MAYAASVEEHGGERLARGWSGGHEGLGRPSKVRHAPLGVRHYGGSGGRSGSRTQRMCS